MNKTQALNSFWNGFGLKAYDENSVPDKALKDLMDKGIPYITYEVTTDSFDHEVPAVASLWYRSSTWADVTEKEMQIADFITRGGRMIAYDGGAMWIQKGTPWSQRMGDPSDDMIKRIVLNLRIEYMD